MDLPTPKNRCQNWKVPTQEGYAALFVDFENVYYFLKNELEDGADVNDVIMQMIKALRAQLAKDRSARCIVQHAYADFERLGENAQGALYLVGVDSHNVLGTDHKNAADMRLCIDAMETLYTRPEIHTFVFIAGDRDYIPVVKHLKKHARSVLVVSFHANMSGDLLVILGEENFIDAALLVPDFDERIASRRATAAAAPPKRLATAQPAPVAPPARPAPRFEAVRPISDPDELKALDILFHYYGDKPEVWVSPYLYKLRDELPLLEEFERKALVSNLADRGAISVEKRRGAENDFSVILVNWDHPAIRERSPG
jgi:hypothetical protein